MVYNKCIVIYPAIAMRKPTASYTTDAFSSSTVVLSLQPATLPMHSVPLPWS